MNYKDNPRVAALIHKGEPRERFHKKAKPEFGPKDIPALARMATDVDLFFNEEDTGSWVALVHAWHELGLMRAPEGVAPLLAALDSFWEDDEEWDEVRSHHIPPALAFIGEPALEPTGAFLRNSSKPMWGRVAAATALQQMVRNYPALRERVVALMTEALSRHAKNGKDLNGMIIAELLDLKGVEGLETMREAFAAKNVDLSIAGDIEDVEIELGVRTERTTSRLNYFRNAGPVPIDTTDVIDSLQKEKSTSGEVRREAPKVGRNEPCPCGSGKKYKKCCLHNQR